MSRVRPKVLALDMDGVIIENKSSWRLLHEAVGSIKLINEERNSERFVRGEISYAEWMLRDTEAMVRAWGKCLTREDIIKLLLPKIRIRKGINDLVSTSRRYGLVTAIVSGGIYVIADYLGRLLGVDYVFANKLLFDDRGCLKPGGIEVVNPLRKHRVLAEISSLTGKPLSSFIYVGDSSWDLNAFKCVGYPVLLKQPDESVGDEFKDISDRLIIIEEVSELEDLIRNLCSKQQ